jgi:hypothetical protein
MKCFGCGVEKQMGVLETSKWAEKDGLCDEPIPPLHVIECQSDSDSSLFKAIIICLECHHKLEPDMWISESMWKNLNPVISFDMLPMPCVDKDMWNPENYQEIMSQINGVCS